MNKRKGSWIANYVGILGLLCVFVIGSLVLMNVGVRVYANIVEHNGENFRLRASLSYVANKVHQYDMSGRVVLTEEEGVPVLVLKEEIDGERYLTRIYCYEGNMMELFQEEGLEHKLADGMEVMELSDMKFSMTGNRLEILAVDGEKEESLTLYMRSES